MLGRETGKTALQACAGNATCGLLVAFNACGASSSAAAGVPTARYPVALVPSTGTMNP